MLQYSPKIVTDSLVMCLDPSQNKSYPTTDLPVKGGLLLWLDASDDTTFSYSSGVVVSQWRDKSGNNFHANQSITGQQPTRNTVNNGRKSVFFNAASRLDYMTISSGISLPTDASIFIIYKPATQIYNYAVLIDNYHGLGGAYGFVIQRVNNLSQFYYANGNGSTFVDASASPWTYTDNVIQLSSLNKSSSTATPYISGTVQTSRTVFANTAQYTTGLAIGYWGNGGGRFYNGDMCEILIFNRSLSSAEMKQVHTYLGQKWGISNTDRSIVDLSGNNYNGLFGNGTAANMPDYDFYNKGALTFNGTSDYINLGNASSIRMGTGNFTISTWIKILTQTGTPTYKLIITSKNAAAAAAGYGFAWNNSVNKFLWSTANGSSSSEIFTTNTWSSLEGIWANVVMIRQNGATNNGHFYINGVYESLASAATVLNVDTATNMTVANTADLNSNYWFKGLYGSVCIYNRALSAAEVAQNYEAQKSKFTNTIVQQGLVLNIDIDNPYSYAGAGATVYDVSPTALSWTATNTTYNASPIKYLSYNGSNSSLVSSTSTAYDSQTITMECWCYPNTLNQLGFLFEKGAVNSQYSMFFSTTNIFYFRTIGGTINNQDLTFTTTTYLTVSAWNHIVCTYNGSAKTIYVNGAQVATVAASGTLQTGQTNQYIGKYGAAGDNYPFNGRIAESRVYNIALTAAQVLQNYNATRTKYGL